MNTNTNTKYVIGIVIGAVLLLVAFVIINNVTGNAPTSGPDLTQFAMCLKNSGTTFYGAFWCPHCAATKAMFGDAKKYLPYHECSTPNGQGQLASCDAVGVKGYPTWVFPDGTRLEGETTLATLSQRSGCPLPAGEANGSTSTSTGASSAVPTGASSAVGSSSPAK